MFKNWRSKGLNPSPSASGAVSSNQSDAPGLHGSEDEDSESDEDMGDTAGVRMSNYFQGGSQKGASTASGHAGTSVGTGKAAVKAASKKSKRTASGQRKVQPPGTASSPRWATQALCQETACLSQEKADQKAQGQDLVASPQGQDLVASQPGITTAGQQLAAPGNQLLHIDGRSNRTKKSVSDMLEKAQKELQDLVFDEDHDGVIALGEAGQEIVKSVNIKIHNLTTTRHMARVLLTRLEKSPNALSLDEDCKQLSEAMSHIETLIGFAQMMVKPIGDLDQTLETAKA